MQRESLASGQFGCGKRPAKTVKNVAQGPDALPPFEGVEDRECRAGPPIFDLSGLPLS